MDKSISARTSVGPCDGTAVTGTTEGDKHYLDVISTPKGLLQGIEFDDIIETMPNPNTLNYEYYLDGVLQRTIVTELSTPNDKCSGFRWRRVNP